MDRSFTAFRAILVLVFWIGIVAPASADKALGDHYARLKLVTEMLATAVAYEMDHDRYDRIDQILRDTVHEQVDVISAAIRKTNGEVISHTGNHMDHWTLTPDDRSIPTQVHVPLYEDDKRIAMVEVRFNTYDKSSRPGRLYFADVLASYISPDWLEGKGRQLLTSALRRPVDEYRYVLSAAVRRNGELIASVGNHENLWREITEDSLFTRKLTTPVYQSGKEVATVEVTVKTVTVIDMLNSLLF